MTLTQLAPPPTSTEEYDFSYSISTGKFRFRLGEMEWLCDKIAPDTQVWCRYSNNDTHHLTIVCQLDIEEYQGEYWATCWPPEDGQLDALQNEPLVTDYIQPNWKELVVNEPGFKTYDQFPQGKDTHWRMCALKPHLLTGAEIPTRGVWRARDERARTDGGELYIVNGYHGLINMNWLDGSNHVFADDGGKLDTNGIIHFGGCCDHRNDVEYI